MTSQKAIRVYYVFSTCLRVHPCLVPVYPVWQSWWLIILAPLACFGSLCGQCGCGTDYSGPLLWEVLVLDLLNNV